MELFSVNKFLNQSQVSFSYFLIIYHQLAGHMPRNRPAMKSICRLNILGSQDSYIDLSETIQNVKSW